MSLYAKWLERGRFLWPSPADGVVTISPAQPSLATCLRALTGGCRNTPGGRRRWADRRDLNRLCDRQLRQRRRIVILWSAMGADDSLPDDKTTLKTMLRAERAAPLAAETNARTLLIEKRKLTIKKLRHEQLG